MVVSVLENGVKTDLMAGALWGSWIKAQSPINITYLAKTILVNYSCSLKVEGILNSMGGGSILKL